MASGANENLFDLSGDGLVDEQDQSIWLELGGAANLPSRQAYLMGDANLDGSVNTVDFDLWKSHRFQSLARWSLGDFNGDGAVDLSDLHRWNQNKFLSSANSVPEPEWLGLLALSFWIGILATHR